MGDPLAVVFNRERGEPGVLHRVSACLTRTAEIAEDFPMRRTRLNDFAIRTRYQGVAEIKNVLQGILAFEQFSIRDDAHDRAKYLRRDPIGLSAFYEFV